MKTEIKIAVEGLAIGMYVSRLDRPWLETSFRVQGVEVKSRDDIEEFRKFCNFVYVDVDKGSTPEACYHMPEEQVRREKAIPSSSLELVPNASASETSASAPAGPVQPRYQNITSFESELEKARIHYHDLSEALMGLENSLRADEGLHLEPVKRAITGMTESIVRNPAAMMWVISLRKINDNNYTRPLGNSAWCATFGRHLGLDKEVIETLALGGLLLDVGKVRQPVSLLQKTGQLSEYERQQMNRHVYLGVKLLEDGLKDSPRQDLPAEVINMIATHHERIDGSGYPQGLIGNDIPLFGRVAGIVDSYDAMTSQSLHVNGEPMTPNEAITELYELRGKVYQTELIDQFIQAVGLYPTGSLVELNTGEVGAVVAVNGVRRLRPSLVVLLDRGKRALLRYSSVDLSKMGPEISVSRGLAFGAFGIDMSELFQ